MEINSKEDALKFFSLLEDGAMKIIEKTDDGKFNLNIENKKLIQQLFVHLPVEKHFDPIWRDKIPLLDKVDHFRMVPGAIIRRGACIKENCVIMPSFINIGTHIGHNTMIDSGVTIGSCAYIGNRCHISSNVVIAGVLEPISNMPVVIDDDVFVGAQSLIAEGVFVSKGSVISSGVHLTASTKIIDRATNIEYDHVPPYSVVVPGFYESAPKVYIQCAYIIKTVDEKTRSKTSINDILRG